MSITKPYTFTAGTKARANEVNANFDTLYSQVNVNSSLIEQNANDIDELDDTKADVNGNATQRFAVADAVTNSDAVNKQTVTKMIGNSVDLISGLVISKDNNTTIRVTAGSAYDSTREVVLRLTASKTKTNSNQGANATYYVYIIGDNSGNQTDILISTSSTTPGLPSGYTRFRIIGYFRTNGSKQISEVYGYSNSVNSETIQNATYGLLPDYNKRITLNLSSGAAVGRRGWLNIYAFNNEINGHSIVNINGCKVVEAWGGSQGGIPGSDSTMVMVDTNDIVTYSGSGRTFIFIPFVGG